MIQSYVWKTPKTLRSNENVYKIEGYKINIKKSVAFLHTNNKSNQENNTIKKKLKYLEINSVKEVEDLYNEKYKSLLKTVKEDIRRRKDVPCSSIGRLNNGKILYHQNQLM
jgi:tRNA(Ser,Leu) C12 N-acetylase TAN1